MLNRHSPPRCRSFFPRPLRGCSFLRSFAERRQLISYFSTASALLPKNTRVYPKLFYPEASSPDERPTELARASHHLPRSAPSIVSRRRARKIKIRATCASPSTSCPIRMCRPTQGQWRGAGRLIRVRRCGVKFCWRGPTRN